VTARPLISPYVIYSPLISLYAWTNVVSSSQQSDRTIMSRTSMGELIKVVPREGVALTALSLDRGSRIVFVVCFDPKSVGDPVRLLVVC
jgi:hypothetical protein